MSGKFRAILLARQLWVDIQLPTCFHIEKHGCFGEGEIDLGWIENPQHGHLVPLRAEIAELLFQ
jgi:hypothetical protein